MYIPPDSPSHTKPSITRRFGSPYTFRNAQENDTSDTLIAETFDDEVICSTTGGSSLSRGDVQEDFRRADAPTSTTTSTVDRYFKQKRSAQGKVAYVVFSGRDAGVFYNWTVASAAISGLEDTGKVYKGYASYEGAHSTWEGFISTGVLPCDVAASLGSRQYPVPPTPSSPRDLSLPTTPKPSRTYDRGVSSHPSTPTRRAPSSTRDVPTMLSQSRDAAVLTLVQEEAFRADQEDFWVVFAGSSPGVHQGREAGERAFGQFANPSFVRTSTREQANQVFVDGYMALLVAHYVN